MTTQNTSIQKQGGALATIKEWVEKAEYKNRLQEMLGENSGAFTASIINVVKNSRSLQSCKPDSVMNSCMIAAAVNLSIEPSLGQAAIVPYKEGDGPGVAQFQLMYRGIIQLCIRSGQYKTLNCTEVYADEIDKYNPITGEVTFKPPETYKLRYTADRDKHVVGHYIYFELLSGFKHSGYMTCAEAMAHAARYSKAYQYDKRQGKKGSAWSTHPIEMGNKTIILRELKRYGVMSIKMQQALVEDKSETYEEAAETAQDHIASDMGSQAVDTNFEEPPQQKEQAPPPQQRRTRKPKPAAPPTEPPEEDLTPDVPTEQGSGSGQGFICTGQCGKAFDSPVMKKDTVSGKTIYVCPNCGSKTYEAIE